MSGNRLESIRLRLQELPQGNITVRHIRGKERRYLQWRENGKQRNKYIRDGELENVAALVEERKRLEAEYRELLREKYRGRSGAYCHEQISADISAGTAAGRLYGGIMRESGEYVTERKSSAAEPAGNELSAVPGHAGTGIELTAAGNMIGQQRKVRAFNTTGVCNPKKDYMVDLGGSMAQVKELVDDGRYFTITRARQFGKTTLLSGLAEYLNRDYYVVSMDFQMQMSSAKFRTENSFALAFARAFANSFQVNRKNQQQEYRNVLRTFTESYQEREDYELVELFQALSELCRSVPERIVLMIDEVDSAANNQVFLDFLAQLRGYYLHRGQFASFQSVILAGVCDIRNLKRRLRPEEEHRDNSPWNIAADFDVDMSFRAGQIAQMLWEYETDHLTGMEVNKVAGEIYEYTAGYPYLVSRMCQLLAELYGKRGLGSVWSHTGILEAVRTLVGESNSLFDDMAKKLKDYPQLRSMLYDILFCGKGIPYNPNTELVSIGAMFGFLKEEKGQVAVANRIFEIWFYNLFIAEEAIGSRTYDEGQRGKSQFVRRGELDVEMILKRFVEHFTESFGADSEEFVEENGRKLFLLYIRPLINGTGNYYIEVRTRSMGRTDLIIDYLGKQYIIEMKIWHGEEYNTRGEEQLIRYLKDYHQRKGYMLSFNFNKKKEVGVRELHFSRYTLVEAVV